MIPPARRPPLGRQESHRPAVHPLLSRRGEHLADLTGEGTDTVQSSTIYTLPTNVENLNLNAGADTLDGKAGNDYLLGGAGNDTCIVAGGTGQERIQDYDTAAGNLDAGSMVSNILRAR